MVCLGNMCVATVRKGDNDAIIIIIIIIIIISLKSERWASPLVQEKY